MTKMELKDLATTMGLEFSAAATVAELTQLIESAGGVVASNVPSVSAPAVDERVTIIIAKDKTDKLPVQVFVNGMSYVIERGEKVTVPKSVLEVLDNSLTVNFDEDGSGEYESTRFPYRIVG